MSATPEREAHIFNAARKLPVDDRAFYLDGACAGDALLRQRVEELLRADEAAGAFLLELATGAEESPAGAGVPDSAQTLRAAPGQAEQIGDRIDRYKLLEKIGEGGFGVVYVAEQKEPVKRRVALKIIKLGMDTKQVVARFGAERQALALMDHPNIAKVLDAGATSTGRPFFVMELVKGTKLTDYCDKNLLSTKERLDLFIKVCRAIQHAHQKGIIHRDIKPSNILVTLHDGVPVPKVIDFGIAKATQGELTDQTVYTQYQQFIGTPAYMSPEQAEMSGLDIDTRSDIYSLGVLLYELLTGKTPFDPKELMASGLEQMRRTIREKEPPRPSTRLSTMVRADLTDTARTRQTDAPRLVHLVRGDLDWIVMKALEKDRARRYETANSLASDIQRHLSNEPIVARPPSNLYRLGKMVQRNKLAAAAAGAVLAALVLGFGFSLWQAIRATRSERSERNARAAAEQSQIRESSQRALAEENARKATESERNASRLLYAGDMRLAQQAWDEGNLSRMAGLLEAHRPKPGAVDPRGFEYFYFQNLAQGEQEHVLHGHTNAAYALAISPDGKWLASLTQTDVRLWDLASRTLASILSVSITNFLESVGSNESDSTLSFSFDSQYLSIGTDTGLQLFHLPTRQVRTLPTGLVSRADFSPVTNLIVFDAGDGVFHSAPRVFDYTANRQVSALKTQAALCWSPDGAHLLTGRWTYDLGLYDTAGWTLGHSYSVNARVSFAAISPDGYWVAAADWQGSVHLIETASGKEIGTLPSGDVRASILAFSRDGKLLATGSRAQTIQIWDVASRQLVRLLRGHKGKVTGLAFTPDGRMLASSAMDGDVMLWDLARKSGETRIAASISGFWLNPPRFSPDGKWLAFVTNRTTTLLVDASRLQPFAAVAGEILSFSPDSAQFATLFRGKELQIWTVGASSNRARIDLEPAVDGQNPRLSPDGAFVAFLSTALERVPPMDLCEAASGKTLLSLDSSCCEFLPDGRTWAYENGSKIKFRDLQSRAISRSLECNALVAFLTVSPDGMILAASHPGGLISLWDLKSGAEVGTLAGHQALVLAMAFSPDGRTLASGSEDRTIKLWHLATRREVASFTQDKGVYWLAFSPDNQMLISGELDSYQVRRAPRGDAATFVPGAPKLSMADLPTNSLWRVPDGAHRMAPGLDAEQETCFTNLLKIHAAIMAYRKDHHQMPDWLGDLVPAYLTDTNCFICPVQARTRRKPKLNERDDLKAVSSYLYDFNARPATLADDYALAAPGDTLKAWREKQLARYGPIVPVVRCVMHPQFLTVTFAGERRMDTQVDEWRDEAERAYREKHGAGTNAVAAPH